MLKRLADDPNDMVIPNCKVLTEGIDTRCNFIAFADPKYAGTVTDTNSSESRAVGHSERCKTDLEKHC